MSHGTPLQNALKALAALAPANGKIPHFTGSAAAELKDVTAAGFALLDDADASAQRTTLGLGSLATLATINNGNWSGTDLTVANGGTGASSAADARTNLGLVIGTDVQAQSAHLDDLGALSAATGDGEMMVATGAGAWALESGATLRSSIGVGSSDTPSFATPTQDSHAATKGYVDSAIEGLDVKTSAVCLASSNINLGSASNPGAIDGVTLSDDEYILLTGQTTASQNGLYKAATATNPTSWVRSDDMAAGASAKGAFVFIEEGTVNADTGWVCTSNAGADTVGTDALSFSQFSGAGSIAAGSGLTKTGNTINAIGGNGITANADDLAVDPDSSTGGNIQPVNVNANGVGVDVNAIAGTGLEADGSANLRIAASAAGAGLTGGGAAALAVDYTAGHDYSGKVTTDARSLKIRTVTATGNFAADDDVVVWNGGSDGTLTLEAAATAGAGRRLHVKNIHATSELTIEGNGSELVDGAANRVLDTRYQSVILVCDGVGWFIF